jgi:prevent-host-death family protein
MHDAKTHLSRLVDEAAAVEEIVIARSGRPVARIVALKDEARKPREFGRMKGKIWIADDFDAPLPDDLLDLFYNGPVFPEDGPSPHDNGPALADK